MLVLTRRMDEEIVICDGNTPIMVIMLCSLEHGRVRLGFTAADNFKIHRREVFDRIQAELAVAPEVSEPVAQESL